MRGGRAKGNKTLVGVAVEIGGPGTAGAGWNLADASASSLHPFLTHHVEPGATVITDASMGYTESTGSATAMTGAANGQPAPAARSRQAVARCHRVASLAKRWLLGTHQGSIEDEHLQSYLNEFGFRFNRRRSRSRGLLLLRLLELAISHEPVRYRELVADPKPKAKTPTAPAQRGSPPSLDRPQAAGPGEPLT